MHCGTNSFSLWWDCVVPWCLYWENVLPSQIKKKKGCLALAGQMLAHSFGWNVLWRINPSAIAASVGGPAASRKPIIFPTLPTKLKTLLSVLFSHHLLKQTHIYLDKCFTLCMYSCMQLFMYFIVPPPPFIYYCTSTAPLVRLKYPIISTKAAFGL